MQRIPPHDVLQQLAHARAETKARALTAAADAVRQNASAILEANTRDLALARGKGSAGAFLDRLIQEHMAGKNVDVETAMAKWWTTENLKKVVDECLQFFGGYGYMEEYPIARAYRDVRVQTIFAGTTEIMKEIISRSMLK